MVIDTHQHFWRYTEAEFGWIGDDMAGIRRDFDPPQLRAEMETHDVDAVVAVQARQSVAETRWLLDLANQYPFIAGVVGWLPLASRDCRDAIDEFAQQARFVGARHVLQGEEDDFFHDSGFNVGLAALAEKGRAYDLLVVERQLPRAIELVDRHPALRFVLDHLGKPQLPGRPSAAWTSGMRELARRPNVTCKISGGIVEADLNWTPPGITPFLDVALEALGPKRLMFGSNWPVSEAAGGYGMWIDAVRAWAQRLSPDEQATLFSGAARSVYRLGMT